MKNTVATFRQAKGREKLVMLTAYDYSTAKLMDRTGVNALLVGDSLGMVMLGYPDTLSVTLEDMIRHCAAVARGACSALAVCDMPFMSCQVSVTDTVRNAGRLVKEGRAQAVKLGRTLSVFGMSLTDDEGVEVASGNFTFYITGWMKSEEEKEPGAI